MAQVCIERYGRIDILCLNAGIYPNALTADMTESLRDEELALKGTGLRASPGLGRFGENLRSIPGDYPRWGASAAWPGLWRRRHGLHQPHQLRLPREPVLGEHVLHVAADRALLAARRRGMARRAIGQPLRPVPSVVFLKFIRIRSGRCTVSPTEPLQHSSCPDLIRASLSARPTRRRANTWMAGSPPDLIRGPAKTRKGRRAGG